MGQAHGDLILSHVTNDVKLSGSLLWDGLVCNPLQLKVEFFEEIFEEKGEKLGEREREK